MEEAMNHLWRGTDFGGDVEGWAVPLDVVREGDNVVVRASMPGVKPDDVQVTIEDGMLTIKGDTGTEREERNGNYLVRERRSGRFHRALRLPDSVEADKAKRLEVKTG